VPGLRLDAIVVRDPTRRARAAVAHPDARLLSSADEIWTSAADIDLVVVAAPNRVHAELAHAAIAAGIAVVVDKPLARSAAEAGELVVAATRAGVMLTPFQNRRWDGDLLTVAGLIAAGTLGRVDRFESRFERWRPEVSSGWRERADPDEAGGLLLDLGSHLVDQALYLFGPVAAVYAEIDVRRPGAQVDDDAFIALTHASGVRSHLWMSAVAAQPGPRMRVLGDRAGYVKFGLDVQEDALLEGAQPGGPGWGEEPPDRWGRLGAGDATATVPTVAGAYQRFYEGVVATLQNGAPPPVDPADAVIGLAILEAARASSRDRRTVVLD
jgi:predicted dehydrogenase